MHFNVYMCSPVIISKVGKPLSLSFLVETNDCPPSPPSPLTNHTPCSAMSMMLMLIITICATFDNKVAIWVNFYLFFLNILLQFEVNLLLAIPPRYLNPNKPQKTGWGIFVSWWICWLMVWSLLVSGGGGVVIKDCADHHVHLTNFSDDDDDAAVGNRW